MIALPIARPIAAAIAAALFSQNSGAYSGPSLRLGFSENTYLMGAIGSVPSDQAFASLITLTRASGGGRFNAAGVYEWLGNDVPRLDYDPVTLAPRGLLIEEQRTNLLLNSDTLATQTRTVTATAHTLTFYGTGSVALSGAFSGTLVGTGAANRVSLTFTPTAGSLTLTVTGSCTSGQLEAGAFPTSYIPTVASQVTRSADVASVNTLSPWYNASEGTLFVEATRFTTSSSTLYQLINDSSNRIWCRSQSGGALEQFVPVVGGVNQAVLSPAAALTHRSAFAYKANDFAVSLNGASALTDVSGSVPSGITRLDIGHEGATRTNGHVQSISYYPRRLSNTELQEITA